MALREVVLGARDGLRDERDAGRQGLTVLVQRDVAGGILGDGEVLPHVPDAWMDRTKDKVGYEINFNRHFYRYIPPRPLEEIDAELKQAEEQILRLLKEVTM